MAKNTHYFSAFFIDNPLFLLKLLNYADGNTMYSSDKNANIVINTLKHDFLHNIRIIL